MGWSAIWQRRGEREAMWNQKVAGQAGGREGGLRGEWVLAAHSRWWGGFKWLHWDQWSLAIGLPSTFLPHTLLFTRKAVQLPWWGAWNWEAACHLPWALTSHTDLSFNCCNYSRVNRYVFLQDLHPNTRTKLMKKTSLIPKSLQLIDLPIYRSNSEYLFGNKLFHYTYCRITPHEYTLVQNNCVYRELVQYRYFG